MSDLTWTVFPRRTLRGTYKAQAAFERPEDEAGSPDQLHLLTERQFLAFAAHAAKRDMSRVAKAMRIARKTLYHYLHQAETIMGCPNQVRRGQRRVR